MPDPASSQSARLLARLSSGDHTAEKELFALLYSELHDRARALMRQQPHDHTLQPTALLHEAWLRVGAAAQADPSSRSHFLRLAASAMRSVLVDHARARATEKRGGGAARFELAEDDARTEVPSVELLALDEALDRLASIDAELARVAELRLFAGLEHHEIAATLGVSTRTVERAWKAARAQLRRDLEEHP